MMIRTLLASLAAASIFLAASSTGRAMDLKDRLAAMRQQEALGIEMFKHDELGTPPEPEIRHLADAAFSVLALGEDPKTAEAWLRLALTYQNMDPSSPDYGKVIWKVGHPEIQDNNSIEFTISSMAPAVLRYGDKLSPAFRQELIPHLKAAIVAIRNHQVPVTYTNIYLMKLANLMMLGRIVNDPTAIADGRTNLDTWLAFTSTNGITEYDSPVYSTVHLMCLDYVYLEAPDAATKAKARAALDFVWSDLAANYFPGRDSLGGPHSRCYDFLYQTGSLQHFYFLAGLAPALVDKAWLGGAWLNTPWPGDYMPSQSILDLAAIPERIVQQRFGADTGRDRYNYITPDFDIGSTSSYYGPQDMPVSAEFASTKKLPVVGIVADPFDAPFGLTRTADKTGHLKPKHLKVNISSVQEKGTILALYDLSPELPHNRTNSIATNVILPVNADGIYFNGSKLDPKKPFDLPADAKSVVCLREGNAALAVRVFAADGIGGSPAQFALKYDGNAQGAARLVAYHYKGKPARQSQPTVRAGVFLHMEHCASDADFAAFMARAQSVNIEEQNTPSEWSASVDFGGAQLSAGMNLPSGGIAFRKVNGQEVQPHTLTVNGQNLSDKILGRTN
jgi:hypothetical protein